MDEEGGVRESCCSVDEVCPRHRDLFANPRMDGEAFSTYEEGTGGGVSRGVIVASAAMRVEVGLPPPPQRVTS